MTWEEQQMIISKVERRYIPALTKVLQRFYDEAVQLYRENRTGELSNKFFDHELMNAIRAIHLKAGVAMARAVYRSMPTVRQLKAGQMGISDSWLAAVNNFLSKFALQFVTNIMKTERERMMRLFERATKEGWSYERLAQEIATSGMAVRRARVIARTEAHRGAMAGSKEGAKSLPYEVIKEWLSASDSRVRREPRDQFDHRELSGQQKEMDEPFHNEEDIMFPGDPNAMPGNTIQCRCVMNYIPKRDERGMLILKK